MPRNTIDSPSVPAKFADGTSLLAALEAAPPWATSFGSDEHGTYATIDLVPGHPTVFRWIPPGRFLMGSPENEQRRCCDETQHWVTITQGFWLAETPCTQAEWLAVMGENPSYFANEPKSGQHPVEQVSWDDCQAFCARLEGRFPGLGARLPTEAEWEYACRAGTATAFNNGSACTKPTGDDPVLREFGWFIGNSGSKTHPVREKRPNAWVLHDTHGNVWEWCGDWYGDYPAENQRDPIGPATGQARVFRGGSWRGFAWLCRSAYRSRDSPDYRGRRLGFRLAAVQSSQASEQGAEPQESRTAAEQAERSAAGEDAVRAAARELVLALDDTELDLRARMALAELAALLGMKRDERSGRYV